MIINLRLYFRPTHTIWFTSFQSSTPQDEMVRQMARLKPVAVGLQKQRDLMPLQAWAEAAPWLSDEVASGGKREPPIGLRMITKQWRRHFQPLVVAPHSVFEGGVLSQYFVCVDSKCSGSSLSNCLADGLNNLILCPASSSVDFATVLLIFDSIKRQVRLIVAKLWRCPQHPHVQCSMPIPRRYQIRHNFNLLWWWLLLSIIVIIIIKHQQILIG